jgi:hypothetical protein
MISGIKINIWKKKPGLDTYLDDRNLYQCDIVENDFVAHGVGKTPAEATMNASGYWYQHNLRMASKL